MKTFLFALLLAAATCPTTTPKCPMHPTTGIATFDHYEYPEGKQVVVYKCSRGDKFAVPC